jgi:hypothetical protein
VCGAKYTFEERSSVFIRDKPIFSSERSYIRAITARVQLGKISGRDPQGS